MHTERDKSNTNPQIENETRSVNTVTTDATQLQFLELLHILTATINGMNSIDANNRRTNWRNNTITLNYC